MTMMMPPPLSKPFTPATLSGLRTVLKESYAAISAQEREPHVKNAAVLIPFCNVGDEPGILLTVRGGNLRVHSGEISFPGGRVEEGETFSAAALRETQEEIGVHPEQVDVLGQIGPSVLALGGEMRVWPYVGFVHANRVHEQHPENDPLPSLSMSALTLSPVEVVEVFHLPLSAIASAERRHKGFFRDGGPYETIDVGDLVKSVNTVKGAVEEVGPGSGGRMEVWGLTGWYLGVLMKVLGVFP